MDPWIEARRQYTRFATEAAESPCFSGWASSVIEDQAVLDWIATLPQSKQQPNLVFAAARWNGVAAPGPFTALRTAILDDEARGGPIRRTIMQRSTQTNEVGRLATLVPAMAQLHPTAPMSLLEVGASAGLCLFPDRWSYRWNTEFDTRTCGDGPELICDVTGPAPLPDGPVRVARRGGIDLHPLDVTDDDEMAWLENLVWPEQEDRRIRLRTAIQLARDDRPSVASGDLLVELADQVAQARRHGPVVVFHSAVIAYLEPADRVVFDQMMRDLVAEGACHWISNEAPAVLPSISAAGTADVEASFVLGIDGRAVALTHGHGRWLRWLEA